MNDFLFERVEHVNTGRDKKRSFEGDYMDCGKKGEEEVINLLQKNPKILGIEDLRNLRQVHEADIDIAFRLYSGHICLAEIKTDTWLGTNGRNNEKNVLNEVLRINHYSKSEYAGYLGWSLRSPAQFLFMYAPNRDEGPAVYKAKFSDMRLILQRFSRKHKLPNFIQIETDEIKTTYAVLIPEKEYKGIFTVYELSNYN